MSNAAKLVVENSRKEALILDLQKEISGYKNQIELAKENEQTAKENEQDQFIFFGSLNYWARESLNFRLAFDFLDPFDDVEEDEKSRVTLGVEAFLTPYLQASAHYKLKNSIPQDIPGNTNALTLGLHAFF